MTEPARVAVDLLVLFGVGAALAVPIDARADELSAAELAAIDRALAASASGPCDEARDHLRSLRDAYGRQEAAVVRDAIAARVPMVLDTLRFCIETSAGISTVDAITPARQALEAARGRAECAGPVASMEALVAAWESETSPVVRTALASSLDTLAQNVRFCVETLDAAPAGPGEDETTPATHAVAPSGGRALGSPFPRVH